MADRYTINRETLTGIADAVRGMRYEKLEMTPAEIEAKIRASHLGIPISVSNHIDPETGKWKRPTEYPDLDSIDIPDDFDGVYLTYDLRKTPGYGWIGVYIRNSINDEGYHVERGHISDGIFIVDESYELESRNAFRHPLEDVYGDVQLWRVRSDGHIITFGFMTNNASGESFYNNQQPCVERVGKLPYFYTIDSRITANNAYYVFSTMWLERDAIEIGRYGVINTLSGFYWGAHSIQEIDTSLWLNSENWRVDSLYNTFGQCYSLRHLDLSHLKTSEWPVNTFRECFQNCSSLLKLDLSNWDASKWPMNATNAFYGTWTSCRSLQELKLFHDISSWQITSFTVTWDGCYSLESLSDIEEWDVGHLAINSFNGAFRSMYSLKSLDLSKWDTSNFDVENFGGVFDNDISMHTLKLPLSMVKNQTKATGSVGVNQNVIEFTGTELYVNQTYSNAIKLTRESLLSILNRLPTVTAARTITLGQTNRLKLTEAEIAIATQKGWTVA